MQKVKMKANVYTFRGTFYTFSKKTLEDPHPPTGEFGLLKFAWRTSSNILKLLLKNMSLNIFYAVGQILNIA